MWKKEKKGKVLISRFNSSLHSHRFLLCGRAEDFRVKNAGQNLNAFDHARSGAAKV